MRHVSPLLPVLLLCALSACSKDAPAAPAPAAPTPAAPAPAAAAAPATDAQVKLGHALFFDKRLSVDNTLACYSCHQNEDGNGGHEPLAIGAGGKKLPRHSPVIWNVGAYQAFYWDGRSPTLEAQALAAWAGGNMGVGKENLDKKATELAAIPGYQAMFAAAYPGEAVTSATVAKAIASYERTLTCENTAWDRHNKGAADALGPDQKAGLDLFMGKAGCVACHAPPLFSAAAGVPGGVYFNTGIGTDKPEAEVDVGRMAVTKAAADWAAFKPPSLRNVSKSAPYFHDGSKATLEEAVRHMAGGGIPNKNLSPLLVDKKLTDAEMKSLVAFLGALDCEQTLEAPPLP